jgi:hypothetical protein
MRRAIYMDFDLFFSIGSGLAEPAKTPIENLKHLKTIFDGGAGRI